MKSILRKDCTVLEARQGKFWPRSLEKTRSNQDNYLEMNSLMWRSCFFLPFNHSPFPHLPLKKVFLWRAQLWSRKNTKSMYWGEHHGGCCLLFPYPLKACNVTVCDALPRLQIIIFFSCGRLCVWPYKCQVFVWSYPNLGSFLFIGFHWNMVVMRKQGKFIMLLSISDKSEQYLYSSISQFNTFFVWLEKCLDTNLQCMHGSLQARSWITWANFDWTFSDKKMIKKMVAICSSAL